MTRKHLRSELLVDQSKAAPCRDGTCRVLGFRESANGLSRVAVKDPGQENGQVPQRRSSAGVKISKKIFAIRN